MHLFFVTFMAVTMFYTPVCLIYVFCINRLVDIIAKLNLQKSAVVRHMSAVLQPILEKGIVDHSILHKVLVEYFTIADKVLKFLIFVISFCFISHVSKTKCMDRPLQQTLFNMYRVHFLCG